MNAPIHKVDIHKVDIHKVDIHKVDIHNIALPTLSAEQSIFVAPNNEGGLYFNPWGAKPGGALKDLWRWKKTRNTFRDQKRKPFKPPVLSESLRRFEELPQGGRALWLGHASVLIQLDGINLLIDPIFGHAGPVRRKAPPPLTVKELPKIDAVLVTHGHYDHLDRPSLRALAKRFGPDLPFILPRGAEAGLPVACKRHIKLDWWQGVTVGNVKCNLVPAQHWHKRSPWDTNKALWGGFVIEGSRSVYHSGDTGYFGGFSVIGKVFPDLDLAILPLGAYEPRWFMSLQHMAPEESVQAFLDLGAKTMMGMHWGTFDLTDEPLSQGALELLPRSLERLGIARRRAAVLAHGGSLSLEDPSMRQGGLLEV